MATRNLARLFGVGIAVLLTSTHPAWSAVNKCTGADGKVTYTEQPCAQDQSRSTVKTAAPPPSPQGGRSDRPGDPGQAAKCDQARRVLASAKAEVASGRHANKTELLASARQEISNLEQMIRDRCN